MFACCPFAYIFDMCFWVCLSLRVVCLRLLFCLLFVLVACLKCCLLFVSFDVVVVIVSLFAFLRLSFVFVSWLLLVLCVVVCVVVSLFVLFALFLCI